MKQNGHLKVLIDFPEMKSMSPTTDKEDILTSYEIYRVRMKSFYIKILYKIVLSKDGKFRMVHVCNEAIKKCSDKNWKTNCSVTLQHWHVLFHRNGGFFFRIPEHLDMAKLDYLLSWS